MKEGIIEHIMFTLLTFGSVALGNVMAQLGFTLGMVLYVTLAFSVCRLFYVGLIAWKPKPYTHYLGKLKIFKGQA